MPGGRLTYEDRRRIAAGLSEGLGYAEIARRLDRPTSTVSREVQRNGGPKGYRADRAQQLAGQRARRRKPAPPPAHKPARRTPEPGHGRDLRAVGAFADRMAEVLVQIGMPRMTARILTCLATTGTGALTARELTERLRVSPASVSTAVAYLEEQRLIRRERDPRSRRDRYVVDDDIWYRSYLTSVQRNAMLAEVTAEGAKLFGTATPVGGRLENVTKFLRHTNEDMIRAAEHWRHLFAPGDSPPA
ncbi:helix-turn-helix domain-containing protein [Nonomuraea sp. NPDC048892]|uniref:MarR family transcriptional regulator n=1 Tax=Nonomuraea sp. NPDC048892 TaxID=3154624 RepID=UPI0033C268F8